MVDFLQQRRIKILWILALLPLSAWLALLYGSTYLNWQDVCAFLFFGEPAPIAETVLAKVRFPRMLLAALVGAILGISGATTQGLFRNPLADPSLIGVTAGASAGAALMIVLAQGVDGLSGLGLISLGAFVGGAATVLLVYRIASGRDGTSVATMLLAGIAITAMAGGLTSLLEFYADNEMLRRISLWKMGGLNGANSERVVLALAVAVLSLAVLPRYSNALNALLLGESEARHLGISVQRTKTVLIIMVALAVATSVALAGTIAFVGLIVPHIIRILIGPDHRYLLPFSAVGGAILLMLADTVSRTIASPIELPVGLVTAFLGAPFFVYLLHEKVRRNLL